MAKWLARSRGFLGKRLEITQVPEEGQSTHEPVWSKVNHEVLMDMVEHLNDKNETIKVLLAEIGTLKAANDQLTRQAYARPREFARGGPVGLVEEPNSKGFHRTARPSHGITPVPGIMVTINAGDAPNGEIGENVRRAFADASQAFANSRPEFRTPQEFAEHHLGKPYSGDIPVSRDRCEPAPSSSTDSSAYIYPSTTPSE